MNNSEFKFDISEKVRQTFNRIAQWHNGDNEIPNKTNLLEMSHIIVEDILNFALHELSSKTKIGIECDQDALKKSVIEKIDEFNKTQKKETKNKGFWGFLKGN